LVTIEFTELEAAEHRVREAVMHSAKVSGGALFPLDLLVWAVGNRTASLVRGFRALIESRNLAIAGAVLRMQLDTYLRFMAAWHAPNPHDFANAVIGGKKVSQLVDRNGKKLQDFRLVEIASVEHPWIASVYEATSGFVHFSRSHVISVGRENVDDAGAISLELSGEDPPNATDESRREAIECMTHIVQLVERQILGWAATKARVGADAAPAT
jgi:hypothetical protein